jgi:hypothetical protein
MSFAAVEHFSAVGHVGERCGWVELKVELLCAGHVHEPGMQACTLAGAVHDCCTMSCWQQLRP